MLWASTSLTLLLEELTDGFRPKQHINNTAGLLALLCGLLLWATSTGWFRRARYATFLSAHQLHLGFFALG